MRKRWRPFLIKLFLPSLLGLPWLILWDKAWFTYPIKFYADGGKYQMDSLYIVISVLLFGGFLFAIIAPLIFLKYKPKPWRWFFAICWVLTTGFYGTSQWPGWEFLYFRNEKGLALLITGTGCLVLALAYLRFYKKSTASHMKPFKAHYGILSANLFLSVCIAIYYYAGWSIIAFFYSGTNSPEYFKWSINILAITNYSIFIIEVI
jgi:hypothetical protein